MITTSFKIHQSYFMGTEKPKIYGEELCEVLLSAGICCCYKGRKRKDTKETWSCEEKRSINISKVIAILKEKIEGFDENLYLYNLIRFKG